MSLSELITLIIIVTLVLYWLDSIRAKELATKHSSQACKKVLVEFLDDTVMIQKVRLRRNSQGQLLIYREYQFEFTSTGEYRYKGMTRLLGSYLIDIEMEPYIINDAEG